MVRASVTNNQEQLNVIADLLSQHDIHDIKTIKSHLASFRQPVIVKIVVSKILIFFGYIYIWAAGLYSGLRAAVNDKTSCCTIIDSCSQPRVYSSQARWTRNYEAFASSSLLTFVISTFTSGLRYTFSGMLQSRVLRPFHLSG